MSFNFSLARKMLTFAHILNIYNHNIFTYCKYSRGLMLSRDFVCEFAFGGSHSTSPCKAVSAPAVPEERIENQEVGTLSTGYAAIYNGEVGGVVAMLEL